MAHLGVISPPVTGHLNPFSALGRELQARGHRVTVFHMEDIGEQVRAEGLEFFAIGQQDHPKGYLPDFFTQVGCLQGIQALRLTIGVACRSTEMFLRDGPEALRKCGVEALLVDQTEPAGGTLADHLGLPFVTICNALALNREPAVPPPFSPFAYSDSWPARLRNRLAYGLSDIFTRSIAAKIAAYRQRWRLQPYGTMEDSFSPLAQISQQPELFDFPRRRRPASFYCVGPLRDGGARDIPFPWDRLDGAPLIYASLGSMQGSKDKIFRCFAEACQDLPVQLVISHGRKLTADMVASLPGRPIVVDYAPQYQLLSRASLTLTHAGLNTVLDSLSHGVPLIAVPLTFEQPAIAQRIVRSGAGLMMRTSELSPLHVRTTIQEVLGNPSYKHAALRLRNSVQEGGGAKRAADLIEDRLGVRQVTANQVVEATKNLSQSVT